MGKESPVWKVWPAVSSPSGVSCRWLQQDIPTSTNRCSGATAAEENTWQLEYCPSRPPLPRLVLSREWAISDHPRQGGYTEQLASHHTAHTWRVIKQERGHPKTKHAKNAPSRNSEDLWLWNPKIHFYRAENSQEASPPVRLKKKEIYLRSLARLHQEELSSL